MRLIVLTLLILCLCSTSFAQEGIPVIMFEKPSYDFGNIQERDGVVSCTFEFKNSGNETLQILNVQSSCECTLPKYSFHPTLPDKNGKIAVAFNPENKHGAFKQKILVQSNAVNNQVFLTIEGFVESESVPLEQRFHSTLGDKLRSERNHLAFGEVFYPQNLKDTLRIFNSSNEPLIVEFIDLPEHIHIQVQPQHLKPQQAGYFIVQYSSVAKNDWGYLIDKLKFKVNGAFKEDYRITLSANIKQDFSNWDGSQRDKPAIEFSDTVHYFGILPQKGILEYQFKFKNTGTQDLFIRKVSTSCGCTVSHVENNDAIKPGKSSYIQAKFTAGSVLGGTSKTIHVITNDPLNEHIELMLKGDIVPMR